MSIFNKKSYIAAISGGPDSMALLHMYRNYIKAVCTVKYNKREDCQHDVDIVEKYCKLYKIPFELLDVTEEMYEAIENNNFQTKARIIRYDFFLKICAKYNASTLLVAHHMDDFLETAYSQKIKGSKALFYGIKEYSDYKGITIYRPLINLYRKDTLRRYCDDYHIEYAIDSSNDSDVYERNKIRKIIHFWDTNKVHEFLKEIHKYNKEHKLLLKKVEKGYLSWEKSDFEIKLFKQFERELQYYLIYELLNQNSLHRSNANKINGVIDFILGMHGKSYRLTDDLNLIKVDKHLLIDSSKEKEQTSEESENYGNE